jgi:hypothetical protein
MVRTWTSSAVTMPIVQVKVRAIIKPNKTSDILSMGSRTRSDSLAENGGGSTAIWIGSLLSAGPAEQIIEAFGPVEMPNFLDQIVGSQQVAHPSMSPDDAQGDAAGGKLAVQFVQHARACEVHIR